MTFALNVAAAALLSVTSSPADTVLLFDDLGEHHYEISTNNPLAQQYFDQGLRLMWGFNHAEAIRAYDQAAKIDPQCAICYWGIAHCGSSRVASVNARIASPWLNANTNRMPWSKYAWTLLALLLMG